jgi:hypothetical protein
MANQVTKEKLIVFMVGRKKSNGGESVWDVRVALKISTFQRI